jgi:hypothetical protein
VPGARDTDWTHVRVVGDRDAAAPYLSYARKLLGYTKEEAARNNLGTHAVIKRLPDGAVVTAELHGSIPRITITPPGGEESKGLQGLDRFVVFARDDDHINGVDEDWPEQWLDAPGVTRQDDWMTRFHDAGMDAYADFDGNKGIYATIEGRNAFQDGVLHYGNIDHCGKNGYRVSWYGPSSRVSADGYVNPGVTWRRKVFLHGAELLDTAGYEAVSPETGTLGDTAVFGAGIAGLRLYVVQGPTTTVDTSTPPSYPPDKGYINSSVAFFGVGARLFLCRYRLAQGGEAGARIELRVVENSREILWQQDWEGKEIQPWFFSPDCKEASGMNGHISSSALVAVNRVDATVGSGFSFADPAGTPLAVQDRDERFTLTISGGGASLSSEYASLPAGGGTAVLARDYDADGVRVELMAWRGSEGGDDGVLAFEMDGRRWPLQARSGDHQIVRHYLLHADLPQRTLVFAVCQFTYTDPADNGFGYTLTGGSVEVQIWRRGVKVATIPVSAAALATGIAHLAPLTQAVRGASLWSALNTVAIPPSMLLHGAFWMYSRDTHTDPQKASEAIGVFGGGGMFAFLAFPEVYTFGWFRFIGGANTKFGTDRTELYDYEIDRDTSYTPLSCATLGDQTLLSGYPLVPGDEAASLTYPPELGALTGVSGAHSRYHPLWRLGRFDLSPA